MLHRKNNKIKIVIIMFNQKKKHSKKIKLSKMLHRKNNKIKIVIIMFNQKKKHSKKRNLSLRNKVK